MYIGIDNGMSGGVCIYRDDLTFCKMPIIKRYGKNEVDIYALSAWLHKHTYNIPNFKVGIECPVGSKSASAAKSMAGSFHAIRGMCEALDFEYVRITPREWQKALLPKGDTKKEALILAKRLFPSETFILERCRKPHDGIIDAALIAYYMKGME